MRDQPARTMGTSAKLLSACLSAACMIFAVPDVRAQETQSVSAQLGFHGWADGEPLAGSVELGFTGWGAPASPTAVLSFSGWQDDGVSPPVVLSFSGHGGGTEIIPIVLAFAGWASPDQSVTGPIGFSGMGFSSQAIDGALAFSGWSSNDQSVFGQAGFTGFGLTTDGPSAALRFSGWNVLTKDLSAQLSFAGCLPELPVADIALRNQSQVQAHFAATDTDPNMDVEGNWIVAWEDAINTSAHVILTKGGTWDCLADGDGDCWYQFTRARDAPWAIDMWIPDFRTFPTEAEVSAARQVTAEYYYGVLGHWGGDFTGTASQNEITGEWHYKDETGRETWTRVETSVTAVQGNEGQLISAGTPVMVHSDYFGPDVARYGDRPEISLRVFGEGLWGRHRWWIPRESDIEFHSAFYLCADWFQTLESYRDSDSCFSSGGVIGLELTFKLWPQALPGRHYLYLDDHTIPFDLTLNDYESGVAAQHCGY